jgi:hypothetical protein
MQKTDQLRADQFIPATRTEPHRKTDAIKKSLGLFDFVVLSCREANLIKRTEPGERGQSLEKQGVFAILRRLSKWRSTSEPDPNWPADKVAFMTRPDNRQYAVAAMFIVISLQLTTASQANVSHGTADAATNYYKGLAKDLGFSTPDNIFATTLDDVAGYLGYNSITGADLQNLPPSTLMNPDLLLALSTLQNRDAVIASLGPIPIRPDDVLVSRFFAPKIMDINEPEETRKLGWRKLVRLRARSGSSAQSHHIAYGIILFNFFTKPDATPFVPGDESLNTQVMLVTELSSVPPPGTDGPSTLYWLDYDKLSNGGRLSLALNQTFDANELPPSANGVQPYYVPDGCVACHGSNDKGSLVNYLDTDHWFDRLDTDFPKVKARGLPLLFDAQTNDTTTLSYKVAFDVIRRFNFEADEQVANAQPDHDEARASHKWLELHKGSNDHFPPISRTIGPEPRWSAQDPSDVKMLDTLNQYCFRCHGSVKYSVFNKQALHERRPNAKQRLNADAEIGLRMPTDRPLPDEIRIFLRDHLP